MVNDSILGLVCDDAEFSLRLKQTLRDSIVDLPLDPKNLYNQHLYPQKLFWESEEIEAVVIYAHLGQGCRRLNRGVDWLREFRLKGFDPPIMFLSWLHPHEIWSHDLAKAFFASPYFKQSCVTLQLPMQLGQILKTIRQLRPIESSELEYGSTFILSSWIRHLLGNLTKQSNLSDIKMTLKGINERYPCKYIEEVIAPLMQSSNINEFINNANKYLHQIS